MAERIEHRGAGEAGDRPGRVGRQHQGRQRKVAERRPGRAPLSGHQRVERVHPGDRRRCRRARPQAPDAGGDAELEEEDVEADDRQPEGRHRHPGKRDHADDLIGPAVAMDGGQGAERHARGQRHRHRHDRKLDGSGEVLAQIGGDGPQGLLRLAQIALRQAREVEDVLLGQRPVEPVAGAERRDDLGIGGGALAQVRGDRVARYHLRQCERHQSDPEAEEHADREPACREAQEARQRIPAAGGPPQHHSPSSRTSARSTVHIGL